LTSLEACHEHSTHNKILHFAPSKRKGKVKKLKWGGDWKKKGWEANGKEKKCRIKQSYLEDNDDEKMITII
jgi:hypothetical protein